MLTSWKKLCELPDKKRQKDTLDGHYIYYYCIQALESLLFASAVREMRMQLL